MARKVERPTPPGFITACDACCATCLFLHATTSICGRYGVFDPYSAGGIMGAFYRAWPNGWCPRWTARGERREPSAFGDETDMALYTEWTRALKKGGE